MALSVVTQEYAQAGYDKSGEAAAAAKAKADQAYQASGGAARSASEQGQVLSPLLHSCMYTFIPWCLLAAGCCA